MRRALLATGLIAAVALPTACTSSTNVDDPVVTRTQTKTSTTPQTFTPQPDKAVPGLSPGVSAPKGQVDKRCPYIRTGLNQDQIYGSSVPNVADIEGDRIYRTTVLTGFKPVGCRFYFIGPPYEAVADIKPYTFKTARAAHDAMILTAKQGSENIGRPNFVPGVDGILYRTRFFSQDAAKDWAFAFAKGKVLVVVHTQRKDTSLNAFLLGKAVVGKF